MITILVSCVLAFVVYDNYNKNNLLKDKIQTMEFELAMIRYSVITHRTSSLHLLPAHTVTYPAIEEGNISSAPSAPDYNPLIE